METRSITCPRCGRTSHNLNDVINRYCGFCHVWIDDMPERERQLTTAEVRALLESISATAKQARGRCEGMAAAPAEVRSEIAWFIGLTAGRADRLLQLIEGIRDV